MKLTWVTDELDPLDGSERSARWRTRRRRLEAAKHRSIFSHRFKQDVDLGFIPAFAETAGDGLDLGVEHGKIMLSRANKGNIGSREGCTKNACEMEFSSRL